MDIDHFIILAIQQGSTQDPGKLTPLQKTIFLISELEVSCDKDGIDSFVDQHKEGAILDCASAFDAMGAAQLAAALIHRTYARVI